MLKEAWLIIDSDGDVIFCTTEPSRWENGKIVRIAYAELTNEEDDK